MTALKAWAIKQAAKMALRIALMLARKADKWLDVPKEDRIEERLKRPSWPENG